MGFFFSLEVATRIDQSLRYGAPILGVYSYDSALFEYDDHGIRGRPHGIYEKWQLNALGLRGPEVTSVPTRNILRVVTLGASETFGLYETPDSEWPRVLERELRKQDLSIEVLNGAIAGITPGAQLRHLRHRLLPLKPAVVVWVVHYAAFAGLDPTRLDAMAADRTEPPPSPGLLAKLAPRIPRRLRDAVLPRLPPPARNSIEAWRVQLQLARLRSRMGDAFGKLTTVSDGERAAFEHFLARLEHETRAAGSSLLVVLPPRHLDERSLDLQFASFPYVAESWLEDAFVEFAAAARQRRDKPMIGVIDLRRTFGSSTGEFMMDAVHFNDRGARIFAIRIASCFTTNGCSLELPGQVPKDYRDIMQSQR